MFHKKLDPYAHLNITPVKNLSSLLKKLVSGDYPDGSTINLRNCNLDPHGAEVIAENLASGLWSSNIKLLLYGNYIGNTGAEAFANAITTGKCPAGLMLDLSANNIGDLGAKAILKAIESENCPEGLCIDLRGNDIYPDLLNKIAMRLEKNKKIAEEKRIIITYEKLCIIVATELLGKMSQSIVRIMFDYLFDSDNSLILADNLFGTTLKQNIKDGKGFARLGIFPRLSENVKLTAEQWLVILTNNLKEQFNGVKNALVRNGKLIIEFADTPSIYNFSKIMLSESKILTTIQGDSLSIAGDQITEFMLRYGKIDPLSLFSKEMLEKKDEVPVKSCSVM